MKQRGVLKKNACCCIVKQNDVTALLEGENLEEIQNLEEEAAQVVRERLA